MESCYSTPTSRGSDLCHKLGHEHNESTFLNAEDAEALAEVRKGWSFSAPLCEKLCVLCGKIGFNNHTL
jgi:hypothetical protein